VPTGARAVIQAGDGSDVGRVSETVVAMSPSATPRPVSTRGTIPDSTVVYAQNVAPAKLVLVDPRERGVRPEELDDETLRTQIHPREEDLPPANRAERTMILGDEIGPVRAEATLMLPDDAGATSPLPERTMMIPDEPDPRAGGTMQLPEGTMQMQGDASAPAGWTMQKTLILINVACGVLILLGLLVLVLGGGDDPSLIPEK
jgi:hypothetical protein